MRLTRPQKDPDAFHNESPAHRVRLPRFFMARYPVTVAQWRVYYKEVVEGAWLPGRPDGEPFEPLDAGSIAGVATDPVGLVSWYDAMDYGAWLTRRMRDRAGAERKRPGQARTVPAVLAKVLLEGDGDGDPWVITLPSEAEWEAVARGPQTSWRYPWGDRFDPNRANDGEYGEPGSIDAPSAVGCFGGGRSPQEAEEMSGNVWEWTRSVWGTEWKTAEFGYAYRPDYGGREREDPRRGKDTRRVVRGGSFYLNIPRDLRSANRNRVAPYGRGDIGFRLVASPFRF